MKKLKFVTFHGRWLKLNAAAYNITHHSVNATSGRYAASLKDLQGLSKKQFENASARNIAGL